MQSATGNHHGDDMMSVCVSVNVFAQYTYLNSVFKQVIIYRCDCIQSDRFYETWGINPMAKRNRVTWQKNFEYTQNIRRCEVFFFVIYTFLSKQSLSFLLILMLNPSELLYGLDCSKMLNRLCSRPLSFYAHNVYYCLPIAQF